MKVAFLDRDGTVLVQPPDQRVDSLDKLKLYPGTLEALKHLADNDFSVVFLTNQAGIAEGRISVDDFWNLNEEFIKLLVPSGINVLKTYMNGEAGGPDATDWRKPGPNMLIQAAEDFNLDISTIYMAGDRDTDVEAANRAGCKGGILVKTNENSIGVTTGSVYTANTLLEAAEYIVSNS